MRTLAVAALTVAAAARSLTADWKLTRRASPSALKTFSVAMPMRDFEGLDRKLQEIADPFHPSYGQWMSWEETNVYAATEPAVVEEVTKWATSTGATCTALPESLKCTGTVAAVEALLGTELSEYVHKTRGARIVRASAPATVPAHLEGKVLLVTGLTQFPVPRLGNRRPIEVIQRLTDTDYAVTPYVLQLAHNISYDGNTQSTQAPVEYQAYPAYVPSDLTQFLTSVGAPDYTIPAGQTIGPFAPDPSGLESCLDEQYIGAIGKGNTNWYWTESDWMYEFAQDLQTQKPVPSILSMSYAWYELDQCDISPGVAPCSGQPVPAGSRAFVIAVNQLFAKATATGITLVAASGDSGAHGRTDPSCADKNTRPDFPAVSPYVLSVGATELEHSTTGAVPSEPICTSLQCATGGYQIVASNKVLAFFSSGGGFSNVAARPAWQDAVVTAYIANKTAVPAAAYFNATGRGHPDVAALGHNYYIVDGGSTSSVDGTSAATPVVAGLLANLNAFRLKAGKPVVGFVNPLLYSLYAQDNTIFTDVVQGDNTCTEDACPCPANTGFYAAPGWDATTGLGLLNYGKLKATMTAMGI